MATLKTRHQILYKGLVLEVAGYYYKGTPQTYEQPEDEAEFDINEVWLYDTDISSLFNDYNELERITLEEHYS